jgi:predicted O-linked N-acetylglucosamine transferase (SPINDLY family)
MTAQAAAERIRKDEIDFLIDLKGHTRGGRLDILARRPAKTQIHWLGFPGTSGADFIDYFVGDMTATPGGSAGHFTEKLLRLPHSYQINDRKRAIGKFLPREAYGLPEASPVLASFNQTYKITPEIFGIWCEVLREMPSAVLWLYKSNDAATENLRKEAEKRGIKGSRIIFAEPLPLSEHLARYAHVDLALDTFPYGGHTTTSDALWTATPVIALAGRSFASRVSASLLTAVELPQLIANSEKEYRDLIMKFSNDGDALLKIKRHLRDKRLSLPLFDTPRFVKDLESQLIILNERSSQ